VLDCGFYLGKTEGLFNNLCTRRGNFFLGPLILIWMVTICSWGALGGPAGRLPAPARWWPWVPPRSSPAPAFSCFRAPNGDPKPWGGGETTRELTWTVYSGRNGAERTRRGGGLLPTRRDPKLAIYEDRARLGQFGCEKGDAGRIRGFIGVLCGM